MTWILIRVGSVLIILIIKRELTWDKLALPAAILLDAWHKLYKKNHVNVIVVFKSISDILIKINFLYFPIEQIESHTPLNFKIVVVSSEIAKTQGHCAFMDWSHARECMEIMLFYFSTCPHVFLRGHFKQTAFFSSWIQSSTIL